MSKPTPPKPYRELQRAHPDFMEAFESMGVAAREAGPLDAHTVALVKLAGLRDRCLSVARRIPAAIVIAEPGREQQCARQQHIAEEPLPGAFLHDSGCNGGCNFFARNHPCTCGLMKFQRTNDTRIRPVRLT